MKTLFDTAYVFEKAKIPFKVYVLGTIMTSKMLGYGPFDWWKSEDYKFAN